MLLHLPDSRGYASGSLSLALGECWRRKWSVFRVSRSEVAIRARVILGAVIGPGQVALVQVLQEPAGTPPPRAGTACPRPSGRLLWPCPPGGSTISTSARISSRLMMSMSRRGSVLPSTWMTLSSSKQRTTWTMASVVADVGQELDCPGPRPWRRPSPGLRCPQIQSPPG